MALATPVLGQAPATAQVWDVRFVFDSSGPYMVAPGTTQIGITMYARVGILPNSSATGTANLGVGRVGGSPFRMTMVDPVAAGAGTNQGSVAQGRTTDTDGQNRLDTNGQPLAGHFSPFPGQFAPQVAPDFVGSNGDPSNGQANNPAIGSPFITAVVGSRSVNYGSDGSGPQGAAVAIDSDPANLQGEYASVYRMYYFPRPGAETITLNVTNMSARYVHTFTNGFGVVSPVLGLPDRSTTITIPTPGATTLVGLLGLAALRRRR